MKDKIYLKIGLSGTGNYVYKVSKNKDLGPLTNSGYPSKWRKYYPTIVVALNLDIPDTNFREAHAELKLNIKDPEMAVKIEENIEDEKVV